jgi:hypothetical protein
MDTGGWSIAMLELRRQRSLRRWFAHEREHTPDRDPVCIRALLRAGLGYRALAPRRASRREALMVSQGAERRTQANERTAGLIERQERPVGS